MDLERLIRALQGSGFSPDPEDLADILWLASHLREKERLEMPGLDLEEVASGPHAEKPPLEPEPPPAPPAPVPPRRQEQLETREQARRAGLFLSSQATETGSGLHFRTPGFAALPHKLKYGRSLRPLLRKVPSADRTVLDEDATVHRIADTQVWLPVMRPAEGRWLELDVIVDEWPSIVLWRDKIKELIVLLTNLGAFRSVQIWSLWTSEKGETVEFHSGWGPEAQASPARPLRELISIRGNRLVLLLSDAVSPAWYNGVMGKTLKAWVDSEMVLLMHLLPYQFWQRTGLVNATPAAFRFTAPGQPNVRLSVAMDPDEMEDLPASGVVPLPVLPFDPALIARWAQASAGRNNIWVTGMLLPLGGEREVFRQEYLKQVGAARTEETPLDPQAEAMERVQRFRQNATPPARKLAGYLSATVPLNLPQMRLIQGVMLPNSQPEHLAEFYLSGLIKRVEASSALGESGLCYEFLEHVRPLLLSSITVDEAAEVLRQTSSFVLREGGKTVDFDALVDDQSLASQLYRENQPFAEVTQDVLRAMGGKYARLADALAEQGAEEVQRERPVPEPEETEQAGENQVHIVESGETLTSIASRYRIALEDLVEANPSLIHPGQSLEASEAFNHPVRSGDSLSSIAARYQVSVDRIVKDNPQITNPSLISVGQILRIVRTGQAYIVQEGDTLRSVAGSKNISLEIMVDSNPDLIHVGQHLVIPQSTSTREHEQPATREDRPEQPARASVTPKIFISYRRQDSAREVGRIRDRLKMEFGDGDVFRDIADIPAGTDFRHVLEREIRECTVMLVVIGPEWANVTDASGSRRLFDPGDFVRLEVSAGLRRSKENDTIVIPLLVSDARMPSAEDLPDELRELAYHNAISIRKDPDFDNDVNVLIRAIRKSEPVKQEPATQSFEPETVLIPAGSFLMGGLKGQAVPDHETPQHEVSLPAYRIGKYPVTNAQYSEFVRQTGRIVSPALGWEGNRVTAGLDKRPVAGVTWHDALNYCEWLSEKTGREYSLPNEAEWEKACRGGEVQTYPWGDEFDPSRCNQGREEVSAVDAYPPQSPYGCYDLVGNISQWTCTLWGERRVSPDPQYAYPWQDDGRNDLRFRPQIRRVVRGSSWREEAASARCSRRTGQVPEDIGSAGTRIGFRVILREAEAKGIASPPERAKTRAAQKKTSKGPSVSSTPKVSTYHPESPLAAAELAARLKAEFGVEIEGGVVSDLQNESVVKAAVPVRPAWSQEDMARLYEALSLLADLMGGPQKFIENMGGLVARRSDLGSHGAEALAHRVSFSSKGPFSAWTAVHELAHAWDANFSWQLSKALEKYTGGFTNPLLARSYQLLGRWDAGRLGPEDKPGRRGRLPGCNAAGYFYGDKPSGSNWQFNRVEDFAEAVCMYVGWERDNTLSAWARARLDRFLLPDGAKDSNFGTDNWASYRKYFYPEGGDYTKTKRWQFMDDLVKGKIQVSPAA